MTLRRRTLAGFVLLGFAGSPPARSYSPSAEFTLNCQGCHRADGGETPGTVPGLAGSVARFLAVPEGREYLIRVPGVAQAPLDDDALAGVINWMLTRFDPTHVPADFRPYTADEVGRLRRQPLLEVDRVRARLLRGVEQLPAKDTTRP